MGRRSRFTMEFETAMSMLAEDIRSGRKRRDPPVKFDPDFWREATGLPWEYTIMKGRLWDPNLKATVGLVDELAFFGQGAPQVMKVLQFLAAQRPGTDRWVRITLDWLAERSGGSRKIANKHMKRFRRCGLIRLLEQGKHGRSSVYLVPPLTEDRVREAKIEWFSMSRKERRCLRSAELMKTEFE